MTPRELKNLLNKLDESQLKFYAQHRGGGISQNYLKGISGFSQEEYIEKEVNYFAEHPDEDHIVCNIFRKLDIDVKTQKEKNIEASVIRAEEAVKKRRIAEEALEVSKKALSVSRWSRIIAILALVVAGLTLLGRFLNWW